MIRRVWEKKFVRFLVVGGGNAAFGYSLFAFFIYIGIHYSLAALLSTTLGVMFNFKSTGTIVFGNRNNSKIFRFVGVYCAVYLINVAALKVMKGFGVSMYLAGAALLLPMAALSYTLNRLFVFHQGAK